MSLLPCPRSNEDHEVATTEEDPGGGAVIVVVTPDDVVEGASRAGLNLPSVAFDVVILNSPRVPVTDSLSPPRLYLALRHYRRPCEHHAGGAIGVGTGRSA